GDLSSTATQAFRTEMRYRRASVFLVDEVYQNTQSPSQVMVYVPMDQSGLDHDFFMQKYEATLASNTIQNGNSTNPISAQSGTNIWADNAAACHDSWLRNGTFSAACGTNTTDAVL